MPQILLRARSARPMRQLYTNGAPATAQLAAHALATYPTPMPTPMTQMPPSTARWARLRRSSVRAKTNGILRSLTSRTGGKRSRFSRAYGARRFYILAPPPVAFTVLLQS